MSDFRAAAALPQEDWAEAPAYEDAQPPADSLRFRDLLSAPTLTGFADVGVVLLFVRGLNVGFGLSRTLLLWYAFMTVAKLSLLVISWNRRAPLTGPAKWMIGSTIAMALATTVTGIGSFTPYLAVAAFVINLTLSSMLIGQGPIWRYLLGPLLVIAGSAAYHAFLCLDHRMPIWWGRYLYFGYNQFNLGGEIEAIGCLAAALILPRILALPVLAVILFDMSKMQTRAAMLVGFCAIVVILLFDGRRRLSGARAAVLLVLGLIGGVLVIAVGSGGLSDAASSLFLLNDPHRGIETGGSGRSDLWQWSLVLFEQSPLVGHNLGYFESVGFIGSHNMILYGLAQYGLMSMLFVGSLIYGFASLARQNLHRFAVLCCALPLLLFNDRFTNLNPYPFIFFVLLSAAVVDRRGAPAAVG